MSDQTRVLTALQQSRRAGAVSYEVQHRCDQLNRQDAELVELRAEVAELRADRERLDWCESRPAPTTVNRAGETVVWSHWIACVDDGEFAREPSNYGHGFTSLRSAIDAARAKECHHAVAMSGEEPAR